LLSDHPDDAAQALRDDWLRSARIIAKNKQALALVIGVSLVVFVRRCNAWRASCWLVIIFGAISVILIT